MAEEILLITRNKKRKKRKKEKREKEKEERRERILLIASRDWMCVAALAGKGAV